MRRVLALALLAPCLACAQPATSDGTGETSTSTSGSESTSESGESESESESGEDPGPICEPETSLERASVSFLWQGQDYLEEPTENPFTCVIQDWETDVTIELFTLECMHDGEARVGELELALVGPNAPDALPLAVDQTVEVGFAWAGPFLEFSDTWAITIRDPASERLLVLAYFGRLAEVLEMPIPAEFHAPVTMTSLPTVCQEECEDYPGLGVPPECICVRPMEIEVSAGADAIALLHRSAGIVAVPSEPDAWIAVARAEYCDDDPHIVDLVYVAGTP